MVKINLHEVYQKYTQRSGCEKPEDICYFFLFRPFLKILLWESDLSNFLAATVQGLSRDLP